MPCAGPSPGEMLEYECQANRKLYGIHASDLDIATRVACHLSKGEHNRLTKKWIEEHNKLDAQRAEERRVSQVRLMAEREISAAAAKIFRKHGLKK